MIVEWTENFDLSFFKKQGYHVLLNHPRKVTHGLCILSKIHGQVAILEAPIKTPYRLPIE
ncbi:MAG: hypothetical protein GY827_10695 [Cytophagales bacterium]|nr:hypothetical protein [Cytophagales bacterium]